MSNKLIKQISVSSGMWFFKEGLVNKWSLQEYYDPTAPCIFFGARGQEERINNHQGFAFVHFINPHDPISMKFINLNRDNLFFFDDPYIDPNYKIKKKNVLIQFKDFSMFQPNTLGDKIYCYAPTENALKRLNKIQNKIKFEILIAGGNTLEQVKKYKSIEYIKEHYYDKCFLNLNLTGLGGMTTLREMAYMGRKTIGNSLYKFPSFIPYKDDNHVVELINEEAKKIGTVQPAIISHNVNDEWLNVDFWTSK